ncbi:Fatty acyl-CoA reductase 3 [Euphorbia peplus]|nr:Fatty acyl-CoA reductase 3 [Euphorbia peplus]
MEFGNMIEFFENKTILITGVTGFLAKLFIEKILRVQPNVKKLYLLLRASDSTSASQRFHNEVIGKEDDLDFLLNFAATTKFDERYDVALNTNTLGAMNVLCFAKSCPKLLLFVHVSTAYVCGERSGLIDENSYRMGETLSGVSKLSIDEEKKFIETKLHELRAEGATETTIRDVMKDLGIQRAKKYGWPNTYVFTKAMGEMIVEYMKGNLPVIIIRPTMVTSTFQQPFPGWIEGVKTIDAIVVSWGKGKLKYFVTDLSAIVDLIPADMVINAIIVTMVAHANKRCNGKAIKSSNPTILKSMDNFHRFVSIRYTPFLKILGLANKLSCNHLGGKYNILNKKIKFVKRLVDLYQPYLFFHGIFEDSNIVKLLKKERKNGGDKDIFLFDVKVIDWHDYFMNTHIPGVVKYSFER